MASEDTLSEIAPTLDDLTRDGQHAQAGWILDALARHGAPSSKAWIGHWVDHARRNSLRAKAEGLLSSLAVEASRSA